jgi:hypothetical protein
MLGRQESRNGLTFWLIQYYIMRNVNSTVLGKERPSIQYSGAMAPFSLWKSGRKMPKDDEQ